MPSRGTLAICLLAALTTSGAGAAPIRAPLSFELNVGQADPSIDLIARGAGHAAVLRRGSALLAFDRPADAMRRGRPGPGARAEAMQGDVVRTTLGLELVGAAASRATPLQPLVTRSHYLIGRDPAGWRTNVPHYGAVRYEDVWPGVAVTWRSRGTELQFDFDVAPGADASRVRLAFEGASSLKLDASGNLLVGLPIGALRLTAPIAWQGAGAARKDVAAGWSIAPGSLQATFTLGGHDPALPLTIDPVVAFATYLGGAGTDWSQDVVTDAAGAIYTCGGTLSTDFPVVGGVQAARAGARDAFVTKMSAAGDAVLWSTYLGGAAGSDQANALALDAAGNVVLGGETTSLSFPVTPTAFQPAHGDAAGCSGRCTAGFVSKLDPAGGTLLASTYLGGYGPGGGFGPRFDVNFYDSVKDVAVDPAGRLIAVGGTQSDSFPTTAGSPARAGLTDAFVSVLDPSASALQLGRLYGGAMDDAARSVAWTAAGRVVIAGIAGDGMPTTPGAFQVSHAGALDAFALEIDVAAPAVTWGSYLGGRGPDDGLAVAVDAAGVVTIAGVASSQDFPVLSAFQPVKVAAWEGFVARFAPGGGALSYSTWLGGRGMDWVFDLELDAAGRAVVAGETWSLDFPLQDGTALRTQCDQDLGCLGDAFVTVLALDGASLCFSNVFGAEDWDWAYGVAVAPGGDVILAGGAGPGVATTAGAFQESIDASDFGSSFLVRLTGFACP